MKKYGKFGESAGETGEAPLWESEEEYREEAEEELDRDCDVEEEDGDSEFRENPGQYGEDQEQKTAWDLEDDWNPVQALGDDYLGNPPAREGPDGTKLVNLPDNTLQDLMARAGKIAVEHMGNVSKTDQDFEELVKAMDIEDAKWERRIRYHECCWENVEAVTEEALDHYILPRWMNEPMVRQLRKGQYLDSLYNDPYQMHNMVADQVVSGMIQDLSARQKSVLYYRSLKLCTTAQVAYIENTSPQNIRAIRIRYIQRLQEKMYAYLRTKKSAETGLSLREREFMEQYKALQERTGEGKPVRVKGENKYPVRSRKKLQTAPTGET